MQTKRTFMTDSFTISYESVKTGWNMPFIHHHNSYEIYILESGQRTVVIDDKEYNVSENDATLFGRNVSHTSRGTTPFSGICIHILDSFLDYCFTENIKKQLLEIFSVPIIHLERNDVALIKSFCESFVPNDENNIFVFMRIMNIFKNAYRQYEQSKIVDTQKPTKLSEKLISYVNSNYVSINSVDEIVAEFEVSESYVFKVFRQSFGTTPKKYLHMLKLNNVCMWLENRHGSIKSIAEKSGFESYGYFVRLFKKEFGCTPTEYRNKFIQRSAQK